MKNESPEARKLIIELYEKLTKNVGYGVDELQLAFDPSVQMINPVSGDRMPVPKSMSDSAEMLLATLDKLGIMRSGEADLWTRSERFGKAITEGEIVSVKNAAGEVIGQEVVKSSKFTKEAREAILEELSVVSGVGKEVFDAVVANKDAFKQIDNAASKAKAKELNVTTEH